MLCFKSPVHCLFFYASVQRSVEYCARSRHDRALFRQYYDEEVAGVCCFIFEIVLLTIKRRASSKSPQLTAALFFNSCFISPLIVQKSFKVNPIVVIIVYFC